jgi:hypothetical protein
MRTRQITHLGCGRNKAKYAGAVKHCTENGLDYYIYKLGAYRIKKMIQRKYGIDLDIENKNLDEVAREAQAIDLDCEMLDSGIECKVIASLFV